MDSPLQHTRRRHRLSSLLGLSQGTQSEQSDGTSGQNDSKQSKRRRAWEQITSILPSQRSQQTEGPTIGRERTTEADDARVETTPTMTRDEESKLPTITTVSIPVTSAVDNRPFFKLEDHASYNNPYVQRVLEDTLEICYSESNRDNPTAARAELSTLIEKANYDIKGDRSMQIKLGTLPTDASLIVIKLVPSMDDDSEDPEDALRNAPGTRCRNPFGLYDVGLSDKDRTQLREGVDAMRKRAAELKDRLELKREVEPPM